MHLEVYRKLSCLLIGDIIWHRVEVALWHAHDLVANPEFSLTDKTSPAVQVTGYIS